MTTFSLSPEPIAAAKPALASPDLAHRVSRWCMIAAIITVITVGASWGIWILIRIGTAEKFTGVSVQEINAHGQAQVYGWVGLFIMGVAYRIFPGVWMTRLVRPRLAVVATIAMIAGILLRSIGMPLAAVTEHGICLTTAGCALQILAGAIFVSQMFSTYRHSLARRNASNLFLMTGFFWFLAMMLLDAWHTHATLIAPTRDALLWQIATYQAPLRDMQIHGVILCMILGVSLRALPATFGVAGPSEKRARRAWKMLVAAVILEVSIFILYRFSGLHAMAALLMIPWIMLAVGVWMIAAPWKLWRLPPVQHRAGIFVRTAYAWLALSLVMLLLLPVYQAITKILFSHAYYGAIRHAITVGFASLMIMGMAQVFLGKHHQHDAKPLWIPFLLVNVGCALRVSMQTLTDFHPIFFSLVGISGVLEVTGLILWGRVMVREMSDRRDPQPARPGVTA